MYLLIYEELLQIDMKKTSYSVVNGQKIWAGSSPKCKINFKVIYIYFNVYTHTHVHKSPLNTGLNYPDFFQFFSSMYYRTTYSMVAWIHGCGTVDMEGWL